MATLTRTCSLAPLRALFAPNTNFLEHKQVAAAPLLQIRHKQSKTKTAAKWQVESERISLRTRGFLRPIPPYSPAKDVSKRLDKVVEAQGLSTSDGTPIEGLEKRFELFASCLKEFSYAIPNSEMCHIRTVGDLRKFYETEIDTTVPYDALAMRTDLPPNLHVQQQYHRFHPDTDTLFGGKTAFPENSTLVTGLKYRKKYQGHIQYPKEYYPK